MNSCERLTVGINGIEEHIRYQEFDNEDGKVIADALIAKYGSKEAAIEEMLYMTVIATNRNDLTTINALACARRYWREVTDAH